MDPPDDSSFDVPVHRVTRQRRASHPPASELLTAHRDEMNRALDAFEREWAVPMMASSQAAIQPTQRRFSTPDLLFQSFLEDRPPFREPLRRSVSANVKTIDIEWLDDDDDLPRAQASAQPRIEDVTSSTDPEVLNLVHRQTVFVVEMPSAVDPHRIPSAHTHSCQRSLFDPNAPVITDVSTEINDE